MDRDLFNETKLVIDRLSVNLPAEAFLHWAGLGACRFITSRVYILGAFWIGRFDVIGKMFQIEEANAGIAKAIARLDDEDMGHFSSQKSAKFKRFGYMHKE